MDYNKKNQINLQHLKIKIQKKLCIKEIYLQKVNQVTIFKTNLKIVIK